jgi:hypothetical protein
MSMHTAALTNSSDDRAVLAEFRLYFGKSPVLKGESSKAYDDLMLHVLGEVKSRSFMAKMLVRHYVNALWNILRYERIKLSLLETARVQALENILLSLGVDNDRAWTSARAFFRSPEVHAEVLSELADNGFDEDSIVAEAWVLRSPQIALIERTLLELEVIKAKYWKDIVSLTDAFDGRLIESNAVMRKLR